MGIRSSFGFTVAHTNVIFYGICSMLCVIVLYNIDFVREDKPHDREFAEIITWVTLIFFVAMTFVSALLIVGITKKNHRFLKPWLVGSFYGIVLVLALIAYVKFVIGVHNPKQLYIALLILVIKIVQMITIYTLYGDFKDKRCPSSTHIPLGSYSSNSQGENTSCL